MFCHSCVAAGWFEIWENKMNSKCLVLVVVCLCVSRGTAVAQERPAKPNVLLLLADDLGWQDVKCYDVDEPCPYQTPNIDSLAKKGVMFWQGYSPTPVCASSRCAILTGIHAARAQKTSVRGGSPPVPLGKGSRMMFPWQRAGLPANELTLPKLMQQHGYVTGHAGKWHISKGGERDESNRASFGFDYTLCDRGSRSSMPDRLSGFATSAADDPFRLDANGYPYHQTSEDALNFLRQNKAQPFFLYYATWLVHAPIHTRSEAHLQKYAKLLQTDPAVKSGKDEPGQNNPFFASMVQELDYYVGQVFNYLDQTEDPRWPGHKLSENTFLIFTSDNGGMEGPPNERYTDNRPLDEGKIHVEEGGTRVPLIITGPGIPAGVQSEVMVNGLDFYPTILNLAGIEKPADKHLDGCDLTPLLLNNPQDHSLVKTANGSVRDTMVWHFPNGSQPASTIRIGDYKLIQNYDHVDNDGTDEFELYRLYKTTDGVQERADWQESKNLADLLPGKKEAMAKALVSALGEMNTTFPYYNPSSGGALPGKKKVPTLVSHKRSENTVQFTYKENGAKVIRADLIYTLDGNNRDEEWFRDLATVNSSSIVSAELPKGTTHYFINLIDENNFLVSYPEVVGKKYIFAASAVAFNEPATTKNVLAVKSEKFIQLDTDKNGSVSQIEYLAPFVSGFDRKDKDGDGVLTPEEHAHASFKLADKDKNMQLTKDEFLSIHRRHFVNFDQNADGQLTPDEMSSSNNRKASKRKR